MIKLTEPADMSTGTHVRKICLPFIAFKYPQSVAEADDFGFDGLLNAADDDDLDHRWSVPERDDNHLRSIKLGTNRGGAAAARQGRSSQRTNRTSAVPPQRFSSSSSSRQSKRLRRLPSAGKSQRRRNDKFLHGRPTALEPVDGVEERRTASKLASSSGDSLAGGGEPPLDLPYVDCIATGWGKSTIGGDLTDMLLQTQVPIHANGRCAQAYGENVRIHRGHLCAGKLNGKGGTCVVCANSGSLSH